MRLTPDDHALVTAAVAKAETRTSGEIVTLVAARSDSYGDVALHWAVLAMLGAVAALATWPGAALAIHYAVAGPWAEPPTVAELYTIALIGATTVFLLVRLATRSMRLRILLTPGTTEARRVRRAALAHFRAAVEGRTAQRTGVLLYLSLAEHRAEIIADAGIHARVDQAVWADAMAALLDELRAKRPGAGLAAAVERIGAVLAERFPQGSEDMNEIPDRLVEL